MLQARFSLPLSLLGSRFQDPVLRNGKQRKLKDVNLIVDHQALRWLSDPHDMNLELARVNNSSCYEAGKSDVVSASRSGFLKKDDGGASLVIAQHQQSRSSMAEVVNGSTARAKLKRLVLVQLGSGGGAALRPLQHWLGR